METNRNEERGAQQNYQWLKVIRVFVILRITMQIYWWKLLNLKLLTKSGTLEILIPLCCTTNPVR